MSEFKGTKGPWQVKHSESKDAFNVVGTVLGDKYKIARCPYVVTKTFITTDEREKKLARRDAKLIAAAPELLEALQDMVLSAKEGYTSFGSITNAEKAIEKALK